MLGKLNGMFQCFCMVCALVAGILILVGIVAGLFIGFYVAPLGTLSGIGFIIFLCCMIWGMVLLLGDI